MTYLDDMERRELEKQDEDNARRILDNVIGGSKCEKRQVAAVGFANGRPVAFGYNEPRDKALSCLHDCPRYTNRDSVVPLVSSYTEGDSRCIAVHAEEMCIETADEPIEMLYVSCSPCYQCQALLKRNDIPWKVLTPVH